MKIGTPRILSRRAAEIWLRDFYATDRAHPCGYGHHDCSTYDGGPCLDETLGNFADLEPAKASA